MPKILISISTDLLSKVDSFCKLYSYERSEFIRFCLREHLGLKENSEKISEKKKVFEELKSEVPNVVPTGISEPKNSEMKQTEPKTFWYQGKKYLVDEFGNEKEAE